MVAKIPTICQLLFLRDHEKPGLPRDRGKPEATAGAVKMPGQRLCCNFDCAEKPVGWRLGANGKQCQCSLAGNVLPRRLCEHAQHAFSKALEGEFQHEGLSLRVLSFPCEDPQPPLDIASGADEGSVATFESG